MLTEQEESERTADARAIYDAASPNDRMIFTNAWRADGANGIDMNKQTTSSMMLRLGVSGAVVFGCVIAVVLLYGLTEGPYGSGSWIVWLTFASSAFGLSIILWISGALEQRLIEIREVLKARA